MKAFGMTHRGAVRKENQDCFRIDAPEGRGILTAVLCDGMGGAQAGSVASCMAADAFMSHAANSLDETSTASDMRSILTDAVNYANIKVYDWSYSNFACMGMGSTLVALVMTEKHTALANVGDSRAYIVSKGAIRQITRDHSLVGELVSRGQLTAEQAKTHPKKNVITRAVGVEATVRCDIFEMKSAPSGLRLLLCSDGVSNMLPDGELLELLTAEADGEKCCRSIIEAALGRGAPDNITAIVADR